MKNRAQYFNFIILILIFAISIWAYGRLPEQVATHWNAAGEIDGYSNRFIGAFLMPLITVFVFISLLVFPKIDPKKANVAKFIGVYQSFITIFLFFMLYMHALTIAINLGYHLDMTRAILPGLGVLFYYIGWMLPQAKQNWFLGIRTAWTLSSEEVWRKTHLQGAKWYKISGILTLVGVFFAKYSIFFVIIPIILSSIYLYIYSYIEFAKEKKKIS